jgi:DNA polymerase-3 subunit delta'
MLSQVQGQAEGVRFLRRVVEGRYTSPLLLVGKEGVGRKFSVLEAAKESFSRGQEDPFHTTHLSQGTHPDLLLVRQEEEKEIGVDAVRAVIEEVNSFPMYAPARYVVVDGADHLTSAAANAFLKTLEEPSRTTRFFLLAESLSAVLPTIRSRCGLVRYRSLPEAFILATIQRFESDPAKALVYARLAEGSVGRAVGYCGSGRLRLRDQVLALLKTGLLRDTSALFSSVDAVGADLALGIHFLEHVLHDLVMVTHDPSRLTNVDVEVEIRSLREALGLERIAFLTKGLRRIQGYLNQNTSIQLPFHVKSLLVGVGS